MAPGVELVPFPLLKCRKTKAKLRLMINATLAGHTPTQTQMESQSGKANEAKSPYNVTYVGVQKWGHSKKHFTR